MRFTRPDFGERNFPGTAYDTFTRFPIVPDPQALISPWSQHPYAHGAIRLAGQMLGMLPFRIVKEDLAGFHGVKNAETQEELDLALRKFNFMKSHSVQTSRTREAALVPIPDSPWRPMFDIVNPHMAKADLWNAVVTQMLSTGCAILCLKGRNGRLKKKEIPREVYVFGRKGWYVDIDENTGMVRRWKYQPNGAVQDGATSAFQYKNTEGIEYEPHEIVLLRIYSPDQPFWGETPLAAAFNKMQQDLLADSYNKAFFENGAEPGAVLTTESDDLNPDDARGILAMWEARHQGALNRSKPAILTHGLKVEHSPVTHQDMEFSTMINANRDAILASLLVHKAALGVTESLNRATIEEANRMVWRNLLLPMASYIEDRLYTTLFSRFPGNDFGVFDTQGIPELQTDMERQSEVVRKLSVSLVPLNDINQMLHLGLPTYSWGDEPVVPMNMAPISRIVEGPLSEGPTDPEPPGPLPGDEEDADGDGDQVPPNEPDPNAGIDTTYKSAEEEKELRSKLRSWFFAGRSATLQAIEDNLDSDWEKIQSVTEETEDELCAEICAATILDSREWRESLEETFGETDEAGELIEALQERLAERLIPVVKSAAAGLYESKEQYGEHMKKYVRNAFNAAGQPARLAHLTRALLRPNNNS